MTVLGTQDRSRIYSEYQLVKNYRAVARNNGISETTVRRIVREENLRRSPSPLSETGYSGIDDFLKAKQPVVIGLINKYLAALSDDERISSATMPQIASAMSTLVEKLTVDTGGENLENIDPLSQSFMELAAQLDAMKRQGRREE